MTTIKPLHIAVAVLVLLAARPAWTDSVPRGAATLTKNKQVYQVVAFDSLRFGYQPPYDVENPDGTVTKAASAPMKIPPGIKALDGTKVAIKGFIIPLGANNGYVKMFLFADQLVTCLFCQGLSMDEWLYAEVSDPKGIRVKDDQYEEAWTIYGTLHVGEEYKDGHLTDIYRLQVEAADPEKHNLFGL